MGSKNADDALLNVYVTWVRARWIRVCACAWSDGGAAVRVSSSCFLHACVLSAVFCLPLLCVRCDGLVLCRLRGDHEEQVPRTSDYRNKPQSSHRASAWGRTTWRGRRVVHKVAAAAPSDVGRRPTLGNHGRWSCGAQRRRGFCRGLARPAPWL